MKKMPDIIKDAVAEVLRENRVQVNHEGNPSDDKIQEIQESGNWEKDVQFAQFYDLDED
mgnify:FL=1